MKALLTEMGVTIKSPSAKRLRTWTSVKSSMSSSRSSNKKMKKVFFSKTFNIAVPEGESEASPSIQCSSFEKQAYLNFCKNWIHSSRGNHSYVS